MTRGSASATRSQTSRSSRVSVGPTSATGFHSSTLPSEMLATASETSPVPFSMTMAKARRAGRGPVRARKAAYSALRGSRRVRQLNFRVLGFACPRMMLTAARISSIDRGSGSCKPRPIERGGWETYREDANAENLTDREQRHVARPEGWCNRRRSVYLQS